MRGIRTTLAASLLLASPVLAEEGAPPPATAGDPTAAHSGPDAPDALARWNDLQDQFLRLLKGSSAPRTAQQRSDLWNEILGLHPLPRADVQAAVLDRHADLLRMLEGRLRTSLRSAGLDGETPALGRRRTEALVLIMDERAYPYPDTEPHKGQVQAQVDARVATVEQAWSRLESVDGLLRDRGMAGAAASLAEIEGYAARCEPRPARALRDLMTAPYGDTDPEAHRALLIEADRVGKANQLRAREIGLAAEEIACITVTNAYRVRMGRAPLEIDPHLVDAARRHSADMLSAGYFSHTGRDGSSPADRALRAGYEGGMTGENIAQGQRSGADAFRAWQHSSGHHRNMLDDDYALIGVGLSGDHWTMLLGTPIPPPR